MKSRIACGCAVLCLRLMSGAAVAAAQALASNSASMEAVAPDPQVVQYDLSGPRFGVTMNEKGNAFSQFGWHFEHMAVSERRGPSFVVQTVLLAGGVENRTFVPNGTLVFGVRLPNGYEFGLGPSVSLGGPGFLRSSIVIAAGRSFRFGGIRVPVNLALSTDKDGGRLSVVTGWAIRNPGSTDARTAGPSPNTRLGRQ